MPTMRIISIVVIIGLLMTVTLLVTGCSSPYKRFRGEVAQKLESRETRSTKIITEADIRHLPETAQRYMRYTGVIGKERVHTVRLKQTGQLRMKPDSAWRDIRGEEYYLVDDPAFFWFGKATVFPLISMSARDKYVSGKGNMRIKLTPLITIADEVGPEMDQGALVRFLNEMVWFPTSFLNDYISWKEIDDNAVEVTIHDQGHVESCVLYIDDTGRLTNFVAKRYRDGDGLRKWSTPFSAYGEFNGLRLPTEGEAIWHLDEGDFSYIRLKVIDIDYNVNDLYGDT